MVKKKSNLFQKLVVEFEGEEGVDVGALTKEYFLKYYETVRKDLFETLISETSLILKMSGRNLTISEIIRLTNGQFTSRRTSIPLCTPLVLRYDNTKIK